MRGHLTITGQPEPTRYVDEAGGDVSSPPVLAGRVVVRERVMVVVESFTYCSKCDKSVLPGVNCNVVGLVTEHVGCAVHQPGGIQHQRVSQDGGQEVGSPKGLLPEIPGNKCWEHETQKHHRGFIVLFLKHDNRVCLQVGQVQLLSLLNHIWMLANHEPTHMRKEKATGGIVRVGIRLGELMVNTVVPRPFINMVLKGHGIGNGQEDPERRGGGVGTVTPEPVSARRHPQSAQQETEAGPEPGQSLGGRRQGEGVDGG